ncbi:AraC family transcriptional regulator [Paenibacillus radicis (ex Gao et al. 2016)]|uniref:HTH-type transcriptional regulator YdeC n=1 Tax=Paenibacillus radicis (ex Gao et al. 2016) TaxID=1737354 RepID=A0A917M0V2_9BACL|nr:AraC family transcriptional regulator [Paenibacillus radicis (ex Gao et al. 2016)]GGG70132.1 putative HTH-type transcriptional regulator YdeC [Paenibacillus radicis (ex Gao et al. 2016)]
MVNKLHEINQYPDISFPYAMYTVNSSSCTPKGRGFNELHWHEELQFTLVTEGKIFIQVNGVTHELRAGQAIFINKGVLHVSKQADQNSEYVSFNFPEKLLAFYSDSQMENKYVFPYTNSLFLSLVIRPETDWQSTMLEILWKLKNKFNVKGDWGWEYEVSILTVQLWLTMITNISMDNVESPKHIKQQQERIQLMISYIHQNYANNPSLQEIADAAHLSVSECTRSFKKTLHTTPYDYLIKYRLKKSAELLNSTAHTITEVASKVGFNHVNHYIQSFKKHYNKTPKEYRNLKD